MNVREAKASGANRFPVRCTSFIPPLGRSGDTSTCILQLSIMRQHIGFLLQFAVLVFLPMLILWQLEFGFRLVLMPALTLVGIVVFWIGYKLREG